MHQIVSRQLTASAREFSGELLSTTGELKFVGVGVETLAQ